MALPLLRPKQEGGDLDSDRSALEADSPSEALDEPMVDSGLGMSASSLGTPVDPSGEAHRLTSLRHHIPIHGVSHPAHPLWLQRKACNCGGSCPRCQSETRLQPKLNISEPGDRYEQEADRVADQVMRMPDPSLQRQMELQSGNKQWIHRSTNGSTSASAPAIANPLMQNLGSGQPLSPVTRTFLEPRFKHDFSQVWIHTDDRATRSAQLNQC
jgi:Domain of unknown function (DUF4157)